MTSKASSADPSMPHPAPRFADEDERLRIVESFSADALQDDPELSAIASFAARLCGAPMAQVTLVEELRQRFLAGEGLDVAETPREPSFCAHAMLSPDLMEVCDVTADPRFADNPFVTGTPAVRFYAGQPLVSDEGAPLGALCVIDTVARPAGLTNLQRQGLAVLAQAVMRRLNAKRDTIRAEHAIELREERLRRMIEGVPQIAWSADADGNFDYFNARWKETVGTDPPKVADDWRPHIHPDDATRAFAKWGASFEKDEEFEVEYRLRHADGSWRWVLSLAVPIIGPGETEPRWFGTVTDIDELQQALVERDMLANELSHRIKNIFAVIIGLATLKLRRTPEHEPFANELIEVLRALGRAHDFVQPGGATVQENLLGLLQSLFAPYARQEGEPGVRVSGADIGIGLQAATPLALIFHELATNSAKYGALSVEAGHVTLEVADRGDMLALTWAEHGGPTVTDTGHSGFGSRLVEMSVTGQLGGSWNRRFEPDGLVMELIVSKKAIAR